MAQDPRKHGVPGRNLRVGITSIILRPVHVDTKYNAADLFTKILGKQDFQRLRDMVMKQLPSI